MPNLAISRNHDRILQIPIKRLIWEYSKMSYVIKSGFKIKIPISPIQKSRILRILTNRRQWQPFQNSNSNFSNSKLLLNNDHLSTKATNLGYQEWGRCTHVWRYKKCQTYYFLAKSFKKCWPTDFLSSKRFSKMARWQPRTRSLFHGWPNNDVTHENVWLI